MKWGKISDGWISMDYVILDKTDSDSGSSGNTTPTSWTGKVIADELLIRSGPGTNHSIVSYLTYGTKVTITQRQQNGAMEWGKIANGWISLTYVQLDASGSTSGGATGGSTSNGVTGTVNVKEWLRVRSGPGTSYSHVGYVYPNDKVTITEQKTVGNTTWGKIASGWISLDYVILDSNSGSTGTQAVTKTIIADCLRVRSGPGTANTIVGYLYYGTKVQVTETTIASDGGLWGKISTGWIHMGYTQ